MRGKTRLLGIAITLLCLGLAFYRVNLGELSGGAGWRGLHAGRAGGAALADRLRRRTVRWRTILAGSAVGSLFELFGVLMVGFATNNLLPARLGELARAYLLRRRTGLRKTFVLASIFLERVFDGLALVAIIVLLSIAGGAAGLGARGRDRVAAILFVGVAVVRHRCCCTAHELAGRIVALRRPTAARPDRDVRGRARSARSCNGLSSMRRPGVVAGDVGALGGGLGDRVGSVRLCRQRVQPGPDAGQLAAACALHAGRREPRDHAAGGAGVRRHVPVLRRLGAGRLGRPARAGAGGRNRGAPGPVRPGDGDRAGVLRARARVVARHVRRVRREGGDAGS